MQILVHVNNYVVTKNHMALSDEPRPVGRSHGKAVEILNSIIQSIVIICTSNRYLGSHCCKTSQYSHYLQTQSVHRLGNRIHDRIGLFQIIHFQSISTGSIHKRRFRATNVFLLNYTDQASSHSNLLLYRD